VDKNIREDQEALKELIARGFRSTPVTLIDDEAIVGFDQQKIEQLLSL
jgi:glutaredoxin